MQIWGATTQSRGTQEDAQFPANTTKHKNEGNPMNQERASMTFGNSLIAGPARRIAELKALKAEVSKDQFWKILKSALVRQLVVML